MITQIISKYTWITAFTLSHLLFSAQIESFGTNSKHKRPTHQRYFTYVYFDFSRECGIGIQNQFSPKWSLDFSAFYIRPNSVLKSNYPNWEFYHYKGAGVSLKPKCQLGIYGIYIGATYSLEYLEHEKIPVAYNRGPFNLDAVMYHNYESCFGWGSTIGFIVGNKFPVSTFNVEPFFGLGITFASLTRTTYFSTSPDYESSKYPYQVISVWPYICMNFGFKIGFGFKENKKDKKIDSKFDAVYVPKHIELKRYMKTIDFSRLAYPKPLRKARHKIDNANKAFLKIYHKHYRDTTNMYRLIEMYYDEIDKLIEEGKK